MIKRKYLVIFALLFAGFSIYQTYFVKLNHQISEVKRYIDESKELISTPEDLDLSEDQKEVTHLDQIIANILINVIRTPEGELLLDKVAEKSIEDNKKDPEKAKQVEVVWRHIKTLINPDSVLEEKGLSCGDVVKVSYKAKDNYGYIMNTSLEKDNEFTFRIGSNKVPAPLNKVIRGLDKDSIFNMGLDAKILENKYEGFQQIKDTAGNIYFEFKVEKIINKTPDVGAIKIFDKIYSKTGKQAMCGDEADIKLKIYDLDGNELVNEGINDLLIGSTTESYGIWKATEFMRVFSERTVLMPVKLLNDLSGKESPILKKYPVLRKHKTVMVDIKLL